MLTSASTLERARERLDAALLAPHAWGVWGGIDGTPRRPEPSC